MNTVETTHCK